MLEELIEELINTYDTNILDNQPDIVQKEFLNISLKNNLNGQARAVDEIATSNQVLMQLICNHYDKSVKKPIADFIGGPKTLTIHWHPVYKKIIYIFGERHDKVMDCETFDKDADTYPVEDYLYDLMLSTDVFLDIYFELNSYTGHEYDEMNMLRYYGDSEKRIFQLYKKFKNCLQYNTRHDEDCQLARIHYFDIRANDLVTENIKEERINIVWIMIKMRYMLLPGNDFKNDFKSLIKKYPKIITLLEKLTDFNIEKVVKFMKEQLEEPLHIKKEFKKINSDLKTSILTFYGELIFHEMKRKIIDIRRDILSLLRMDQDDLYMRRTALNIFKFMVNATSYYADVYLLARVFKDFDMSEMQEKAYKGSTDQPIQAHNIIIYCGDYHSSNYRDFLSSIDFKDITNLKKDSVKEELATNCLDMRNIKQPFFSYNRHELDI